MAAEGATDLIHPANSKMQTLHTFDLYILTHISCPHFNTSANQPKAVVSVKIFTKHVCLISSVLYLTHSKPPFNKQHSLPHLLSHVCTGKKKRKHSLHPLILKCLPCSSRLIVDIFCRYDFLFQRYTTKHKESCC